MRLNVLDTPLPIPDGKTAHFDTGPRSIAAVRVLRISVTDRCNYRCVYCMPEDGVRWLAKDDILSFEEICAIVAASIDVHGIRRFKLTGGEPTMRHDLLTLVKMIRAIPGIEDLSLTTNGQLLAEMARPLRDAGIDRVTISLDSLRPQRFKSITRTGDLEKVLAGIRACEDAGFGSIKINCVAMAGFNDDEFGDFAALTREQRITVRFIEYMPLGDSAVLGTDNISSAEQGPAGGCGAQSRGEVFVSETEIRKRIEAHVGPLVPVDRTSEAGVGPAKVFRIDDPSARGRIGFISAMSAPFCDTCNRLRLTADGILRSCLFDGGEVDIKPILRQPGGTDARGIAHAMSECVRLKPDVHSLHGKEQMSRVGG